MNILNHVAVLKKDADIVEKIVKDVYRKYEEKKCGTGKFIRDVQRFLEMQRGFHTDEQAFLAGLYVGRMLERNDVMSRTGKMLKQFKYLNEN